MSSIKKNKHPVTPEITDFDIGLAISWRRDEPDRELLATLLPAHPRAFWNIASRMFSDPKEHDHALIKKAFADERLLRLGVSALSKAGKNATYVYPHHYFEKAILSAISSIASRHDKSEAWVEVRLASLAPFFNNAKAPASSPFSALAPLCQNGRLPAAKAALAWIPDAHLSPEKSRLYDYGQTSIFNSGCGNENSEAWARAFALAQANGAETPAWDKNNDRLTNPIAWCAVRHWAAKESGDNALAQEWGGLGAELVRRNPKAPGVRCLLPHILGCPPMFEALRDSHPQFKEPTFFSAERNQCLFRVFSSLDASDALEACAYINSSPASSAPFEVWTGNSKKPQTVHPVPPEAIALLAGHKPDPAWIDLASPVEFKISKAIVDKAIAGSLRASDFPLYNDHKGTTRTLGSLTASLGLATPAPKKSNKPK